VEYLTLPSQAKLVDEVALSDRDPARASSLMSCTRVHF